MLFLEYLALFAVNCTFAPEFESCYIFAQIEKRLVAWIQDIFRSEHTYALSNQAKIQTLTHHTTFSAYTEVAYTIRAGYLMWILGFFFFFFPCLFLSLSYYTFSGNVSLFNMFLFSFFFPFFFYIRKQSINKSLFGIRSFIMSSLTNQVISFVHAWHLWWVFTQSFSV